jgi:alpha-glucosidase
MALASLLKASFALLCSSTLANGQTASKSADSVTTSPPSSTLASINTVTISGTPTTFRNVFTMPASADEGAQLLPNVVDPEAVNAQDACPGYKASQVHEDEHGVTAVLTLAGEPCNVYGNDISVLNLKVEYQAANRLAINISPANVVSGFIHMGSH